MTRPPLALPASSALLLLLLAALPAKATAIDAPWDAVALTGDGLADCVDARCVHVDGCSHEAVANACDLATSVARHCHQGDCQVGDPTTDHDHDLVPDGVEQAICGRGDVRDVNSLVQTDYNRCTSTGDLSGLPDADRDGIPDAAEPVLCGIEDKNTGLDGSCSDGGTDYTL